jgi:transcriptional regulator with XRE-family HTH domain
VNTERNAETGKEETMSTTAQGGTDAPADTLRRFGEHIRRRREALQETFRREYSLRSVAAAVGVAPSHISAVEQGRSGVSDEVLAKLASVLREDVEFLQALLGRLPDDVLRSLQSKPLLREAVRSLDSVPAERLEAVVREVQETVRKVRDGEW